jgi:serine protease Do
VALLKIDASALPTVVIGDANKLQVGEWVLAIGSPFGFDSSATAGIVSAKGRTLPNENYVSFIQTDVPINPGNSGGPLFNLKGEVVGVNSQIYSGTGGFMGVSFAIPIDAAITIGAQLKSEGRVRRGWLGVSLQEVSRALASAYGLNQPRGALIADILPGSPAAKSDLRTGDIVLEYEGRAHHARHPYASGRIPARRGFKNRGGDRRRIEGRNCRQADAPAR